MKKILGICSAEFSKPKYLSNPEPEIIALYEEGSRYYDEVVLIDPDRVTYYFDSGNRKIDLQYENHPFPDLSTLLVRNTRSRENSIGLLVNALVSSDCDVVDPIERFQGFRAGKMMQILNGCRKGIVPNTLIVFGKKQSDVFIAKHGNIVYPLISKPEDGYRGRDVKQMNSPDQLKNHIEKYFTENDSGILLIQEKINLKREFRVLIVGEEILGICEKLRSDNKIAANASQGASFIKADHDGVELFVRNNISLKGIAGIDIVQDKDNKLWLLEVNRSPQWQLFESATGINVAEKIIQHAWERANNAGIIT